MSDSPREIEGNDSGFWKTILVATDHSELGQYALEQGLAIAAREGAAAHVVYVQADVAPLAMAPGDLAVAAVPLPPTEEIAAKLRERVLQVQANVARHERPLHSEAEAHVRRGSPASEITALAAELGADVIVVGTHGKTGFQRMILGSVSEKVARTAPCPVLIVRPKEERTP